MSSVVTEEFLTVEVTPRTKGSKKKERGETRQDRQRRRKEMILSWQRNNSETMETHLVNLLNPKPSAVVGTRENPQGVRAGSLVGENEIKQFDENIAEIVSKNKAHSDMSEIAALEGEARVKSKRRETRIDRQSHQRKEIVLGWQRNTPSTWATKLAEGIEARPSMRSERVISGREKRIGENEEATINDIADEITSIQSSDGVVAVTKRPSPTTKSRKRLSPKLSTHHDGHRLSPVADSVSRNVQRSSPRRPGQRRVSQSTGSDRSRSRSKSRGAARRRLRTSKEEATLSWKREPCGRKEKRISGALRVDKGALVEIARVLETQKRCEKEKLEAIGKMRGRRYRTGGVLPSMARSRSPRPRNRKREQTIEIQMTWQRQQPSETDVETIARTLESGTAALGRGTVRRDSTTRRNARTTNSGDIIPMDRRSQRSIRRIRSKHVAMANEAQESQPTEDIYS